jgi:hypothetical protein
MPNRLFDSSSLDAESCASVKAMQEAGLQNSGSQWTHSNATKGN